MAKKILQIISIALFVLPPLYFIYSRSSDASIFNKINITGCVLLIIAVMLINRFLLVGITEKWRKMIAQWYADYKIELDSAKRITFKKHIGQYENYLLALKIPLPALIIVGILLFLSAVEQTAASMTAMLGICSLFWIIGVILIFIANKVGSYGNSR